MIAQLDRTVLPPSMSMSPPPRAQKEGRVQVCVTLPEAHAEALALIAEAEHRSVPRELQWLVALYLEARSDLIEIGRQRRERKRSRE